MQAMDLVPWVRRDNDEPAATVVESVAATPSPEPIVSPAPKLSPEPTAPTASPAPQGDIKIEGNTNAQVLLIFSNTGAQPTWPLSKADDALLDSMLRAIGLSKADICTCSIGSIDDLKRLEATSQQQQFLYFGIGQSADTNLEPHSMTLSEGAFSGWRLPTLEMLRNQPQRKRHAWITLKQLRTKLDQL